MTKAARKYCVWRICQLAVAHATGSLDAFVLRPVLYLLSIPLLKCLIDFVLKMVSTARGWKLVWARSSCALSAACPDAFVPFGKKNHGAVLIGTARTKEKVFICETISNKLFFRMTEFYSIKAPKVSRCLKIIKPTAAIPLAFLEAPRPPTHVY